MADAPDTTAPDAATPDAPATPDTPAAPDGGAPNPPDLAAVLAELAAVKSTLTSLESAKADAEAAAEAARVAALSDAEKLAEDRVAFAAEIEQSKAGIRKEARTQALDRLGVLPAYREFVPDVDPRTTEGAAALEQWAKDRPEVVRQTPSGPAPWQPAPKSALAKIMSGETKNPLVTPASVSKMFGGS